MADRTGYAEEEGSGQSVVSLDIKRKLLNSVKINHLVNFIAN